MSKFLDLLRKLGIFRSGSVSGTYTNAKDRPSEFQMDGVFNAKKDLVNKGDFKGFSLSRILLIVAILIGLLFIIVVIGNAGFSIWTIIMIVLWLYIFWRFWHIGLSILMMVIFLVISTSLSLVVLTISNASSDTSNDGKNTTLTDANFDKKVLKITSSDGSVTGTIGLVKKKNNVKKEYLAATFNMLIKTNLTLNSKCGTPGYIMGISCTKGYEYAGRLVPVKDANEKTSTGNVSAVYCSNYQLPEPYSISGTGNTMIGCINGNTDNITTETFATNFQINFYSYSEILEITTFEIYDRSDFWEPTKGVSGSFTGNNDKAVQQTNPVKTLVFTVTE
ncbi:hypothetical protein HYV12_03060 [Candidatus Dojkabacteria bacterium]|nr:hypothetical protein [Candidatus Dojkabacteria bacterium]